MTSARTLWARARDWATRNRTDGTARRRPGDAAKVVLAVLMFVPLAYHSEHRTATETSLVDLFESLPHGARTLFLILYQLAALWAVGLLVVTVLLLRRWRLARDLAVAAALAWVLGRTTAFFVHRTDRGPRVRVTFDLTDAPRFPLVRLSVAVATVLVASPHLARPTRRIGQWLVALLALSSLYLAAAAPPTCSVRSSSAGVSPTPCSTCSARRSGDPRPLRSRALATLGLAVPDVCLAPDQPVGRALFLADGADGPLRIVRARPRRSRRAVPRPAWRYVAYRDAPPTLLATRRHQVEYEAYLTLLARTQGAHARGARGRHGRGAGPARGGGRAGRGAAPAGSRAGHRRGARRGVEQLRVAARRRRVAHGKLDGRHVLVRRRPVSIVGFDFACSSARFRQTAGDVAELLAATGAIVGADRAVAAAVRGVGPEAVADALPVLQAPAMSGWTHDRLRDRTGLDEELDALRAARRRP